MREASLVTIELGTPALPRDDGLGYLERRALGLWPRLDRGALRRCQGDVKRIAALVSRRTTMAPEAIVKVLLMPSVGDDEVGHWFG
jgi:hypothetical protein